LLNGYEIGRLHQMVGPDRHIVIYYVKSDRSEVYFVTSQPEPEFAVESWSAMGDVKELRKAFTVSIRKSATSSTPAHRCTNGHWSTATPVALEPGQHHPVGRRVPSDDTYMAQARDGDRGRRGASRCLKGVNRDGVDAAFRRFEATRKHARRAFN